MHSILGAAADIAAWFHPFVQHADNLDHAWPSHTVVENMYRPSHLRQRVTGTRVPEMKAADAACHIGTVPRGGTFRIVRHLEHCDRKKRGVAASALWAPLAGAHGENMRQIGLGEPGQPKSRHGS